MASPEADDLWMLEIRLFNLKPGTGAEFFRVADEGTVPLMRRWGIRVLGHYQSTTNPDAFFLVRAFRDADDRKTVSEAFYASPEWLAYEDTVMGMVADYHAVTTTITRENLEKLSGVTAAAC
jgi:hypothetical protein